MPQKNHDAEQIDPSATLRQASALAEHLERLGAQWLPTANSENAQALAERFEFAGSDPIPSDAELSPPPKPVPDQQQLSGDPPRQSPDSSAAFSLSGSDAGQGQSYPGPVLSVADRTAALARDAEQVSSCMRCEILSKCRTKTVFGEGCVEPRVVFIGEGPGRDEDLSGRPFVGKAGQLLTKMILACKFDRDDVYIMNAVKCRPPNNRNPESTEVENCREYFERQLNLLRPEYIVCLGLVSAQALLRTKLSVGRMRGKFHRHFDSKVVVTYHPSYLLRTPAAKKAAWDDLQMMLRDAKLI